MLRFTEWKIFSGIVPQETATNLRIEGQSLNRSQVSRVNESLTAENTDKYSTNIGILRPGTTSYMVTRNALDFSLDDPLLRFQVRL